MVSFIKILRNILSRKTQKVKSLVNTRVPSADPSMKSFDNIREKNNRKKQPSLIQFPKDSNIDLSMMKTEDRQKWLIRNVPTKDCKYLDVWKRAKTKIFSKLFLKRLGLQIQLYGTSAAINPTTPIGDTSLNTKKFSFTSWFEDSQYIPTTIPCGILHPNSTLKSSWNGILIILLIYTATVMPFKLAFIDSQDFDGWWFTDLFIDILFLIDIIVNLNSAFIDNEGTLVTDRRRIFLNYLKSWLLIDLVACIPINLIETLASSGEDDQSQSGDYNNLIRLVRLPRLYRLFRISRIFKMIKQFKNSELIEKLQVYFSIKQSILRLIGFFFTVCVGVHLSACFWYFAAKLENFHPDTWVTRHGYLDLDIGYLYMLSLYWAVTTLSSVGYGDITPYTQLEILISIVWMFFGLFFISFTVGSLSSMLSNLDTKQLISRETMLVHKLSIVDQLAQELNLKGETKQRLRHALRYSVEKQGYSIKDRQQIFHELPRKLRYEIAIALFQGAATQLPFFQNKDQVFIADIVPLLRGQFVETGDYIYLQGEYADEIYFIIKGRIHIIFDSNLQAFVQIQRNSYFGDYELFEMIPRKFSAKAFVYTELLGLDKTLLEHIKQNFKSVFNEMSELARKRLKQNEKTFEESLEIQKQFDEGKLDGMSNFQIRQHVKQIIKKRKKYALKEMGQEIKQDPKQTKIQEDITEMKEQLSQIMSYIKQQQGICSSSISLLND